MSHPQPKFLPISKDELFRLGVEKPDVILVSADAYVDHPSFAAAILGRTLVHAGYSVAIISQPDWKDRSGVDFAKFGAPNLFFAVVPGAVDPMVNAYTPALKRRSEDVYSPGGKLTRPDKTTLVYTNALHKLFPKTPIVIGGIEASLRRFAHYDYWSDSVRQSILADAPASLLVYGQGEVPLLEIAARLKAGEPVQSLRDVGGTCYTIPVKEFKENPPEGTILPAFPNVADKAVFAEAFKMLSQSEGVVIQPHPKTVVVQNPPARALTCDELDAIYELPFTRRAHPSYKEPVPALAPVQFSITTHRGCFGGCSFCAIAHHQGKRIVSRSADSIVREAKSFLKMKEFHGTISDVGGPSANMYQAHCPRWDNSEPCRDKNCTACPSMQSGIAAQTSLLARLRDISGIKHVFIGSGVRYDLIPESAEGDAYLADLCAHHVSGQLKVAPEHISDRVTALMNKPGKAEFEKFLKRFEKLQAGKEKRQYVIPYLMSSHPGCRIEDMVNLALYLREMKMFFEQVQDFTPVPMTLSTAMYYSGVNPVSGKRVYVPLGGEKRIQRALLQWKDPKMYDYVVSGLLKAGRGDLIGDLVPDRGIPLQIKSPKKSPTPRTRQNRK